MTTQTSQQNEDDSFSLLHLQAELTRIDVLIRCYAAQRAVPLDDSPGDSTDDPNAPPAARFDSVAHEMLHLQLGSNWATLLGTPPAIEEPWAALLAQATEQTTTLVMMAQQAGIQPRLLRLAAAFDLDPFEIDVLLITLAPALDPRYASLYGYLTDDLLTQRPSVYLVAKLLQMSGYPYLHALTRLATSPLFQYALLAWDAGEDDALRQAAAAPLDAPPVISRTLRVDPAVVAWLMGDYHPSSALRTHLTIETPTPDDMDHALTAERWPSFQRAWNGQSLLCFHGEDAGSQLATARRLAPARSQALLHINLTAVIHAGTPPLAALRLALRDARLTEAIPYLDGIDACLVDDVMPVECLSELNAHPGLVIVAGRAKWQPRGLIDLRDTLLFDFPRPSYEHRRTLFLHFLNRLGAASIDPTAVADQFELVSRQIGDVVATANRLALARGEPLSDNDLWAAARALSSTSLDKLARRVMPRHEWQDLILPPDHLAILHEIVATVRGRVQVLDQWGAGKKLASSRAVTILFAGEPGTGKTMAAEIIAGDLGQELYTIDLSSMVSKYIGETEKNLEHIFDEAEQNNVVLFFDEADAIFGKRTAVKDAHDRYANLGVSYLLQRMEAYNGVTILATNMRSNLDEAFVRRLHFVVDFPVPDIQSRLHIWQSVFPPDVPRSPELDLAYYARQFKIAGGHIRNVVLAAAYLAADAGTPVTPELLRHALRRELQKMGRIIGESTGDPGEITPVEAPLPAMPNPNANHVRKR